MHLILLAHGINRELKYEGKDTVLSTRAMGDAKSQIRTMLKERKYPEASLFATQIIKLRNGKVDAELYFLRGTACAHHSAVAQAEKDIRAAIALDPKCLDYHLTLCNLLFASGRYESAFREYVRIKNRAPKNAKIRAFGGVLNGRRGKLERTTYAAEAELRNTEYKAKICDQLVSLYLIRGIFDWHARYVDKRLNFYATNLFQIENAEFYLSKIDALPVLTNTARKKRAQLVELIRVSRKQRYDGFAGDWILAGLITVVGFAAGGFFDVLYALSAAASFAAFIRPNYLFNNTVREHPPGLIGRIKSFYDFSYGEGLNDSSKLFRAIANDTLRISLASMFRSLVRASLMPLAVFAGFCKNYSVKHGVVFVAFVGVLAYLLAY